MNDRPLTTEECTVLCREIVAEWRDVDQTRQWRLRAPHRNTDWYENMEDAIEEFIRNHIGYRWQGWRR